MKYKKTVIALICIFVAMALIWSVFNIIVDPFNAFGDKTLNWDSYTQTLAPLNSKVTYVSERFDKFDSYIIGSSSASSYQPKTLDKYFDASFYNMFHYYPDLEYDRKLIQYLVENDDVKNIFLVISPDDAMILTRDKGTTIADSPHYKVSGSSVLTYYAKHLFANPSHAADKLKAQRQDSEMPKAFDAVLPESGTFDRRLAEVEEIGELSVYLSKKESEFKSDVTNIPLDNIDNLTESVRQIHKLCEDSGVRLTVVIPPVYKDRLKLYSEEDLNKLYTGLASVADYWNFAYSSVSCDARYFYNSSLLRNETADMTASYMFDDKKAYKPQDFGLYCKKGSIITVENLDKTRTDAISEEYTRTVPVLMYHYLDLLPVDSPNSQETFRKHMELLKANGYVPVSFNELTDFVEKGTPLPSNPVVITFDDGYTNNYELAYPVLKEYGFKGTIFVIGCSVGHDKYYKDTQHELTPHFGQIEIDDMVASGLMSIESHTYDMHQWPPFEKGPNIRESILPFEGETESDYIDALNFDIKQQNELFKSLNIPNSTVMSFPHGKGNETASVILKENGYKASVTTDNLRTNTIVAGLPQTLYNLGRMTMDSGATEYDLLQYLNLGK